jgi:hypothetical protein
LTLKVLLGMAVRVGASVARLMMLTVLIFSESSGQRILDAFHIFQTTLQLAYRL